jgi:hypothetical protein
MRLSIGPISIGDQVSLTGDADHFPATMRRSRMAGNNSLADWGSRKGATPNRHKEASDAMIGVTIRVARHVCSVECIESVRKKLAIKNHRTSYIRPPITLLPRALAPVSAE